MRWGKVKLYWGMEKIHCRIHKHWHWRASMCDVRANAPKKRIYIGKNTQPLENPIAPLKNWTAPSHVCHCCQLREGCVCYRGIVTCCTGHCAGTCMTWFLRPCPLNPWEFVEGHLAFGLWFSPNRIPIKYSLYFRGGIHGWGTTFGCLKV